MNIYKLIDYRFFIIIPLALLIFSFLQFSNIQLGIEFTGGTLITGMSERELSADQIHDLLKELGESEVRVYDSPTGKQIEIEVRKSERIAEVEGLRNAVSGLIVNYQNFVVIGNASEAEALDSEIREKADVFFSDTGYTINKSAQDMSITEIDREVGLAYQAFLTTYYYEWEKVLEEQFGLSSLSVTTITSTLSSRFMDQAKSVFMFSTVFAFVLVFLYFRAWVPALAVIIGAASDIIIALGGMSLFGIPLTFASFAALLMLIGFSLDTDMLLTIRILKRKEVEPKERVYEAMKTGITMTSTAILSFGLLFLVSSYLRIATYHEIAATALIGLGGDLIATWLLNAVIILAYVERKEKREASASASQQ